jgi:cytochrome b subunit of formate dehydrogenase
MSTKGNKTRLKRFTTVQRCFHLLLMATFLTQAATGLGRMYIQTSWGKTLTWIFGGYETSRTIHVTVGILMIVAFMVHFVYLLNRLDWRRFPKEPERPGFPGAHTEGPVRLFQAHGLVFGSLQTTPV